MDEASDLNSIPTIKSFVLRFIYDESAPPGCVALRGEIRCIQTDQEITFSRWEDAVAFINRFIPLESD